MHLQLVLNDYYQGPGIIILKSVQSYHSPTSKILCNGVWYITIRNWEDNILNVFKLCDFSDLICLHFQSYAFYISGTFLVQ